MQDNTSQGKAVQDSKRPPKTMQCNIKRYSTRQDNTIQHNTTTQAETLCAKIRQDKESQYHTIQDKHNTRQHNTRHDKTRTDNIIYYKTIHYTTI